MVVGDHRRRHVIRVGFLGTFRLDDVVADQGDAKTGRGFGADQPDCRRVSRLEYAFDDVELIIID